MRRNKDGVIQIESTSQFHNYMRLEMNRDKILERARMRKRIVDYNSPKTAAKACLDGIDRLDTREYREGKILLTTIVKCALARERFTAMADKTNDPREKYKYIEEAKKLVKENVYQYYVKEWKYTLEKIMDIERRTFDAIGDSLNLINAPLSIGESFLQGGI